MGLQNKHPNLFTLEPLNKFLMVPRSQKILPQGGVDLNLPPSWIYHGFITSIVLCYMACFPIIPHCCLLSSHWHNFLSFVSAGTVGMLHLLWCVSAGGSRYRRKRETVPSVVFYIAELEGGTAGVLSTQSNCVTVSLLPWGKGHALCLQSL